VNLNSEGATFLPTNREPFVRPTTNLVRFPTLLFAFRATTPDPDPIKPNQGRSSQIKAKQKFRARKTVNFVHRDLSIGIQQPATSIRTTGKTLVPFLTAGCRDMVGLSPS
jgi:hypothetical protein